MSKDIAIKVDNVSKSFKLPHQKQNSIKSLFINMFRGFRSFEQQEVLKDISFEIKKGEFFGIVGRNGSGKSTLLKLLAGIYEPNKGSLQVNGKLTPFIELGVGFSPELTGRENVFLNGALLGFSRKEMTEMYDEIVEFAELENFMDQKLKNYSSGMQVRLAFSIAIRAKSDILILDEVLAVGDEAFQQKCIEIFENYKANKQTIILVTHDMEIVRRFCTKAMLIKNGEIVATGKPSIIAGKYSKLNRDETISNMDEPTTKTESGLGIKIKNSKGVMSKEFDINDVMNVQLEIPQHMKDVKNVGVAIIKKSGEYIYGTNTIKEDFNIKNSTVNYNINLALGPGKYYVMAGLFGENEHQVLDFVNKGPEFYIKEVAGNKEHGLARLKHEWS